MYRVLTPFKDLQDDGYRYQAGDEFPRKGLTVSAKRLNELLTNKNRRHMPMIEVAEEVKKAEAVKPVKEAEPEAPVSKPKRGRKKHVE